MGLRKILGGDFSLMAVTSMVTIQGSSYFSDDHGNTPFYISRKNVPIVTFFGWGFRYERNVEYLLNIGGYYCHVIINKDYNFFPV